jgi:hypothetical protein
MAHRSVLGRYFQRLADQLPHQCPLFVAHPGHQYLTALGPTFMSRNAQ